MAQTQYERVDDVLRDFQDEQFERLVFELTEQIPQTQSLAHQLKSMGFSQVKARGWLKQLTSNVNVAEYMRSQVEALFDHNEKYHFESLPSHVFIVAALKQLNGYAIPTNSGTCVIALPLPLTWSLVRIVDSSLSVIHRSAGYCEEHDVFEHAMSIAHQALFFATLDFKHFAKSVDCNCFSLEKKQYAWHISERICHNVLLHEYGHLALGHLAGDAIAYNRDQSHENEHAADKFAFEHLRQAILVEHNELVKAGVDYDWLAGELSTIFGVFFAFLETLEYLVTSLLGEPLPSTHPPARERRMRLAQQVGTFPASNHINQQLDFLVGVSIAALNEIWGNR